MTKTHLTFIKYFTWMGLCRFRSNIGHFQTKQMNSKVCPNCGKCSIDNFSGSQAYEFGNNKRRKCMIYMCTYLVEHFSIGKWNQYCKALDLLCTYAMSPRSSFKSGVFLWKIYELCMCVVRENLRFQLFQSYPIRRFMYFVLKLQAKIT